MVEKDDLLKIFCTNVLSLNGSLNDLIELLLCFEFSSYYMFSELN